MKYFLMSDDGKKILIYEYKANEEKIYEYKKSRLDKKYIDEKKFDYTFEPGPYKVSFEMAHPNEISSKIPVNSSLNMSTDEFDEMVRHSVCSLDFHNEIISSNEEREKYVEAYANGELKLSHYKLNDMWSCLEAYPERINAYKDYERQSDGYAKYHVDPVFILGPELMVLFDLEEGKLDRSFYYPSYVDNQFECFDFNDTPIDEININSLELLTNNTSKMIDSAKRHSLVLERAKVKVRK